LFIQYGKKGTSKDDIQKKILVIAYAAPADIPVHV
jgi:hypothetical protein